MPAGGKVAWVLSCNWLQVVENSLELDLPFGQEEQVWNGLRE